MRVFVSETRSALKDLAKAPREIGVSYEIWVRLIEEHGMGILREFKGYHDEKLQGKWLGFRSSRLNRKWRVIYFVEVSGAVQIVRVSRVTSHDYRSQR